MALPDIVKKHLKDVRKQFDWLNKAEQRKMAQQRALYEVLQQIPVVTSAVTKVGISQSTFYRWVDNDDYFAEEAYNSIRMGRIKINDRAESTVIKGVYAEDAGYTKFWLRHNESRYKRVNAPVDHSYNDRKLLFDLTERSKNKIKDWFDGLL